MKNVHLPHSIFDPSSRYNRFRQVSDPHEKLLGYFDWLDHVQKDQAAPPKPGMEMAPSPLVIRLDDVNKFVEAEVTYPLSPKLTGAYEVQFDLQKEDWPSRDTPCRILLLAPETLNILRESLAAEGRQLPPNEEAAIRLLLSADSLENSPATARVLSALPELEGSIDTKGKGKAWEEVPSGLPNAPRATWLIVVYDPPPPREKE